MARPKCYDIIIVGAGLIGTTLALWLRKHTDFSLAVIERSACLEKDIELNQRVVALGGVAQCLLKDVDIWESLTPQSSHPYQRMSIWDESSDGELDFDAGELGQPQLGHMVDSLQCQFLLQKKVIESDAIADYFECTCGSLGLQDDGAVIKTDQGEIQSRLVIAADGAGSWVRRQAKIFSNYQNYDQLGIVARIETSKPHQDCAWQRFLRTGPVAILPLAANQSSIVWSADINLANQLMALSATDFSQQLTQALEGRLGEVSLLSECQAFPLKSQRAERYFSDRIVLVGDAAHAIHPLAGQGVNLGFKDIATLGPRLQPLSSDKLNDPAVLAGYERQRKMDNEQIDALMSSLNWLYQHPSPVWAMLRGFGMNWLNRSDSIRGLLAKQAAGL